MDTPVTRYARAGDLNIAYQVVGNGTLDLLYIPGWVSHVEMSWDDPSHARFLRRLAAFSRLILFDKRGTGLSDRVPHRDLPTLEQRMDDVRAVLEAAGSTHAALFGVSEGGNLAALFAATYPERVRALATFGIFAKRVRSDDYPWAPTRAAREAFVEWVEREWGGDMDLADLVPSADAATRKRLAAYLRSSASPGAAAALLRMNTEIDIRAVLPAIRVPTLVLHRLDDRDSNIEEGRYIAARIPGARLVELPGSDHLPWVGDADAVVDHVEEFLTGATPQRAPDRILATLLFTDIVGSTERASALGDARWRELLDRHHAAVRRQLAEYRGREIDTAGDGFFATFDGPARAIQCACAIQDDMARLGLQVRAGLHTGECEMLGDAVVGIAVNLASRITASAAAGEVLVSSTVRDLVAGSRIAFDDRGEKAFKGVPGEWRVFAVRRSAG